MTEPQSVKRARANTAGDATTRENFPEHSAPLSTKCHRHPYTSSVNSSRRSRHGGRCHSHHPGEGVKSHYSLRPLFAFSLEINQHYLSLSTMSRLKMPKMSLIPSNRSRNSVDHLQTLRHASMGSLFYAKSARQSFFSSNNALGHEVQKQFQWDASLVEGMLEILDSMTDDSSPQSLWSKLQELEELANGHCIRPGLEIVLGRLDPDDHEDEEEGDEE